MGEIASRLTVPVSAVLLCYIVAVIASALILPASLSGSMFVHRVTPQYLSEEKITSHYRLFPKLCWFRGRLLILQYVYLCFIVSAGIFEHTASVWEGNWSNTAENRDIRQESSGTRQSECRSYTCYRQTECNAGPAAFWLLGFLLTHPEAMEAVQSEIRGLSLQDTSLQHPPINLLKTHSTPVLDGVLSETLRLTAAVMIGREVMQDKILHMAGGQNYHLRRGDRVCLFPFLSPQMDPQIHREPQIFKYDRFLNEDKTVKDTFYKDGTSLKYSTMPWGAGSSICVGKEFAVTAIKQFVFLLLTHLDLETCDPEAKMPPVNPSRYGFGMLQPDGDLQVRFRLKRTRNAKCDLINSI